MNTDFRIVIPARMASERLPGKPLQDVCGKPLIQRVWECASRASATEVLIATEDEEVRDAAERFGARCQMTGAHHASGSDRIAECVRTLGWPDDAVVVNLQGDEPQMPAECLDQVAGLLQDDSAASAASLYQVIDDPAEVGDPNAVKVVVGEAGRALYFSRAVIPAPRGHASVDEAVKAGMRWKRHVGLYAYRAATLKAMAARGPSPLEQVERLEQLRILESGGAIAMAEAVRPVPTGVDTARDLERVRRAFR